MSFEELFRTHYPFVIKTVSTIIKNTDTAEEIAQEVFIKLYNSDWENIDSPKGWLAKTSVFLAYNYIRSEKRHLRRIEKAAHFTDIYDSLTPSELFEKNETGREVQDALSNMPLKERQILYLRYKGLRYKEIAEILDINPSSVGQMLLRAKKLFRSLYTGDC